MEAKEKAKELVNKMYRYQECYLANGSEWAKECALISIEDQINFLINWIPLSWDVREIMIAELKQVKQEIEKL